MTKLNSILVLAMFVLSRVSHAQTEITKPEELVQCLQSYIQLRVTTKEEIQWEHYPQYEFGGKYLHASWHAYPSVKYGIMYASVGPQNDIYCDYPVNSMGTPQLENGFCKAHIRSGNLHVEYTKDNSQGELITQPKVIGFIQDFKIFCFQ